MSITSAMLAGASGMRANSSALAAISDNIANVNTVGYKRLRNDFTALLSAQSQLTTHNAGGVLARHTTMMTEQGPSVASSIATHLAIAGQGYFVVRGRSDDATVADPYYYTRAGHFTPDNDGFLRNASGYYLHGWPVAANGTVVANPTDLTALRPVQVAGIPGAAEATSSIAITANLNAAQTPYTGTPAYNAAVAASNMASGVGITPHFQIPIQVYDTQGGQHTLTVALLKSGANTWNVEVFLPPGEVIAGGGLVNGQLGRGVVAFTPSGQLDTAATTLPANLTINQNGVAGAPQWAAGIGVGTQTINLDIGGAVGSGGLTNFSSPSVLGATQVNGTPFGSLASVDVDDEGFVTAVFSNGLTRQIYQVPMATFPNVNGLSPERNGVYRISADAGPLALRPAGAGGAGEITSRALESSTVDLAEEFSQLIITQRAYSASSKIITTADEMLDELIRLKR
jgi:flagellar hook protein FlgE